MPGRQRTKRNARQRAKKRGGTELSASRANYLYSVTLALERSSVHRKDLGSCDPSICNLGSRDPNVRNLGEHDPNGLSAALCFHTNPMTFLMSFLSTTSRFDTRNCPPM